MREQRRGAYSVPAAGTSRHTPDVGLKGEDHARSTMGQNSERRP